MAPEELMVEKSSRQLNNQSSGLFELPIVNIGMR
jgi:hypothetical protein